MPPDPCVCCQTAPGVTLVHGRWFCAACAACHQPVLREEPLVAYRRELARVQQLLAQLEARQRIERGEDGFDG